MKRKSTMELGPGLCIYIYVVHSVCDDVSIITFITLSMITMINRDPGIVDAVSSSL